MDSFLAKTRGAIRLLKHSHLSGAIKHEEEFMDIENKKILERTDKEMQLNAL